MAGLPGWRGFGLPRGRRQFSGRHLLESLGLGGKGVRKAV